ncbi:hypothetical protein MMC07_005853 [Pseudocyphellaria aurata]|nr:hypothetical protein [Pseudocyphellaria aurata]
MTSSVGSDLFAFLSLLAISVIVLLLLRHFLPLRTTPAYLLIPIFLAIALPVSIILLVPIDLASSLRSRDEASRGIWLPDRVILVAWRIAYWLTFGLTWFILPLLGEYVDSGYRTPRSRMIDSLRSNGRYQLIVLGCGIAGLIYVFWQNGFATTSVKALIMALAYCWGLVLAIYLMGHGLVAVPRKLYRNADISGSLRRIQSQAPRTWDRLIDANAALEELEAQVFLLRQRKHAISRDHQEWVEEISHELNLSGSHISTTAPKTSSPPVPVIITDRYLAALSRKLIRARHMRVRFVDSWDRLVQEAVDTRSILDASASRNLEFGNRPQWSFFPKVKILTSYSRYLLYVRVVPAARMALAALFSLASVCIVWSELIKFVAPRLSIIRLTVVTHRNSGESEVGFIGQVSASIWILYMCTAALASFDDVKIWGNRALVRRNTYGESAAWYSGQIARLTVPLAYNFVTFLPPDVHRETTFYLFLGRLVNLTPLGENFDYFFPILILIPVCATFFNLYGRVKSIFGFGIVKDDVEIGGWKEGRDLIERELNGRSHLGLSSSAGESSSPPALQTRSNLETEGLPSQLSSTSANSSTGVASASLPPRQTVMEQRQAQRLADATWTAAEEDENIFQDFAHRVRNTFDNVERPGWLPEIGKRPKWMGGVAGNSEGSGRAEFGRGMGRWFGGRPAEGRLRL